MVTLAKKVKEIKWANLCRCNTTSSKIITSEEGGTLSTVDL